MSSRKCQHVHAKIKLHIAELENSLRYDKTHWENSDKASMKSVIESHHYEMIHHVEQAKYHLEKVMYHRKRLDEIEHNKKSMEPPSERDATLLNQGDAAVKRNDEDKMRIKVKRVGKSSSLKYVLQWENFLEEQLKQENSLEDVPNVSTSHMVKTRIEKFEGYHKPKRHSSTIETFLDFSGERPRRIKSYPIIEDSEGEREIESLKTSEHESVNKDESQTTKLQTRSEIVLPTITGGSSNCEDERVNDKPRIVEMHYKKNLTTMSPL